jgi:hypothetical protein
MPYRWTAFAAMTAFITVAHAATVVPTTYEAGHFFATPVTSDGKTLRLLVDTGGGGVTWWLRATSAKPLGLTALQCGDEKGFRTPTWEPGKELPPSKRFCGGVAVIDTPQEVEGDSSDGMVGGWYLSDATWTFDYPARRLSIEDAAWHPDVRSHTASLGLPGRPDGTLAAPYPRIAVIVDGKSIDLLLDTGATAHPSHAGLAAMHTPVVGGFGVASYITTTVFGGWHKRHPDWLVVQDADNIFGKDRATRSIRVPSVDIAGWTVGPIWFTERSDAAFVKMSSYMDNTIHGAAGGNILQAFRMTVDYRHRKAYFSCVVACAPAK